MFSSMEAIIFNLMSADKLSAFQGLNYDDYPESEEESTESETSAE